MKKGRRERCGYEEGGNESIPFVIGYYGSLKAPVQITELRVNIVLLLILRHCCQDIH